MSDSLLDMARAAAGGPGAAQPALDLDPLLRAAGELMQIQDVTRGWNDMPLRVRGQFSVPAEQVLVQLRPVFEAQGCTPRLTREEGLDVVVALPVVFTRGQTGTPWLAIILFVLTILSVFSVGMGGELYMPLSDAVMYRLTGEIAFEYPADVLPSAEDFDAAIMNGLLYTAALLGILGAHEMGHFLMARRHGVHTTFPLFIPLPIGFLGTLGAVIAMREPAPNRKVQFDIGVAGPLAGLVIAIPVLLAGLMLSEVNTSAEALTEMPPSIQQEMQGRLREDYDLFSAARSSFQAIFSEPEVSLGSRLGNWIGDLQAYRAGAGQRVAFIREGQSLLYLGMKYLIFGEVLPLGERDVWISPVAMAGWAGLLVTAINLLPIGQLDGGHTVYGLFGEKAAKLRLPFVLLLLVLGLLGLAYDFALLPLRLGWSGWLLWVVLIQVMLRGHAPVLDEITGLDAKRRWLAIGMILIFLLLFMPIPLVPYNPLVTGWM